MNHRTKKALVVTGGFAMGAWLALAFARKHIDRRWPLRPAIEAERHNFESRTGARVSYYEDLSGEGTPILLVHSVNAAASAYEMRPLFEAMRGTRPVFAIDLPGFGFSDRSPRAYTRELYAEVLGELIDRIASEHGATDVVALSLGAELAARAARAAPDRVRSLTMISPTGFRANPIGKALPPAKADARADARSRALAFEPTAQLVFDLLTSRVSLRYFLQKSFTGRVDEGLVEYAYATSHQPDARHAPLRFVSGALFDPQIRASVYEKLPMPVHVLYDEDPYITFDNLERTVRRCDTWRATRIAHTRGMPQFERTADTLIAMNDFFRYVDELTGDRPTLELDRATEPSVTA